MTGYNQGDNGAAVGPTSAQLYSGEFSEQSCMMCHVRYFTLGVLWLRLALELHDKMKQESLLNLVGVGFEIW